MVYKTAPTATATHYTILHIHYELLLVDFRINCSGGLEFKLSPEHLVFIFLFDMNILAEIMIRYEPKTEQKSGSFPQRPNRRWGPTRQIMYRKPEILL